MRGGKRLVVMIFVFLLLIMPVLKSKSFFLNEYENIYEEDIMITKIKGGFFKITVEIKNNGENDISDLNWNISISGGSFGLINRINSGTVEKISPGEVMQIKSNAIFGLGDIIIRVRINNFVKSYNGYLFLIYARVNPGITVDLNEVASGLNSPTSMAYPTDDSNRLFITDQIGKIYIIENEGLLSNPFLDISDKIVDLDSTYDERGLLGMAFHPDYDNNGRFFVYYSAPTDDINFDHESILAEYKVSDNNPNIANKSSEKIILEIKEPEANHNGGQLKFGPDNNLYIGVGDGGGQGDQHNEIGNGQNTSTLLGTILRLYIDGKFPYQIPSDNPFVGKQGLDEIYAFGFRNPWRFSFDSDSDRFFVADVGQDEWEEINIVEKGGNYGWRIMEGFNPYDLDLADTLGIDIETLEKPIHEYSHSVGRSITGGYVYRGSNIADLQGKYVFADWSTGFFIPNGKMYYLEEINDGDWTRFNIETKENFNQFILSLGIDWNEELYVLHKTSLGPLGSTGSVSRIIK